MKSRRGKPPPESHSPPSPDGRGVADRRAEFARLTGQSARDRDAERAFIEGKMEMVRGDPSLSEAEKDRALSELRRKLRSHR